ncbi:MAG TPA: DUF5916 domain-containing protein [Candidatus Sulfotelmatobacter sp.]|nr:DUF5916 domain-containing protein [Candidatus Sulfotelmatobacter sp.]
MLVVCLALLLGGGKISEAQDQAAGAPAIEQLNRSARAVHVERPPRMDGTLNDPIWQQASPITDFRQREPFEGQRSTENTEVRILYTHNDVYFGIACHDSTAGGVVASQLRRDVSQEYDDYFEIIVDSRRDRRNAYLFQINPLGTQRDGLLTDEPQMDNTQDGDPGWDGVWTSEARITEDGWTATVEIPFSTLNFMRSQDVVWGLNFKRFIRRKNEEDLWSGWKRTFGVSKISQAGELHGITDIGSGRLFIVKPYALAGFSHLPASAQSSGLNPGMSRVLTGGLDIKYGIRSDLVANLTGNTDFADSDVDVQQFNLTPYKLFFPEKRQFFLENANVFSFPMSIETGDQLFFSRQIGIDPVTGQEVPINGGGRVTGSLGGFELGVMDVDTRSSGPNPYANYAVVRVKRSIGESGSYLGVMGIDKRSGNPAGNYNQNEGVDGRLVLWKNLALNGFAAQTRSPWYVLCALNPSDCHGGQTNLGAGVIYRSNWFDFFGEHRKIGPNFNPAVGFLERTDCVCDFADANFKARPEVAGVRELNFEGFIAHDPDTHGAVQTQEWQTTFRAEFNNGSYTDDDIVDVFAQRLTSPFNIYQNLYIPMGVYNWARHQLTYGSATDRKATVSFYERFGGYYNGTLNEARVRATYRASPRLAFSFSEQWNRFHLQVTDGSAGAVPQARDFSVVLGTLETDYAFSRLLSLSTILQMNTANAQGASANIRLRWNYRPDSDLYVIYTAGQKFASLAAANPAQFYEHRFVVKYTYSFRP